MFIILTCSNYQMGRLLQASRCSFLLLLLIAFSDFCYANTQDHPTTIGQPQKQFGTSLSKLALKNSNTTRVNLSAAETKWIKQHPEISVGGTYDWKPFNFVDKKGKVTETVVLKGIPNTGLDEAAMTAIAKTRFKPAKQRDRAVGVWISIPVNFRLKG